jgi:hypothetical protein
MGMPKPETRAVIRRTIVLEYDVTTDQYDKSYSDADVLAGERNVFLRDLAGKDYDTLADTVEIVSTGPQAPLIAFAGE